MTSFNEILLVDDDRLLNSLHKLYLSESSIANTISVEENVVDVIPKLKNKEYNPDIILLDLNMPRLNGWDFLDEYKKHFKPLEKQIFIFSASVNPNDFTRAEEHPYVCGFLEKPLNPQTIESKLIPALKH